MPARRTIAIGAAVAAIVGLGGVAAVSALDDPDGSVDAVDISDATAAGAAARSTGSGTSRQVPGLDELTGTVTQDDSADDRDDTTDDSTDDSDDRGDADDSDDSADDSDDRNDADDSDDSTDDTDDRDDVFDDLEINGVDLDFGPDDWVATAEATADFDGDGTTGALRDELAGLVGQELTVLVRFDDDGDDADVYVIGEHTYRDVSAPAPWLPAGSADDEALRAAAAGAVGEGAEVIELDAEDDGEVAWEAKVRAADGTEREVRLDAEGTVIDVQQDD
ncbi:MAG TPA: hypothetical protein VFY82_13400 [Acidimicrobiales bacterium]|nr:hypothetical protein [Acidimicrobiales bacterium]